MTQTDAGRVRMGIMGCSDFAARTMIGAMRAVPELELVAVASRTAAKAEDYAARFDCEGVVGYERLLARDDIDCIYVALPTGLHFEWVLRALEAGKHMLVEKSFASDLESTQKLVERAKQERLLLSENFSFHHHSQYAWVRQQLDSGAIGDVRLFRSNFSFPPLKPGNFRYDAALGGGALLDAGAYMVRASRLFLGEELELVGATLRYDRALGVDIEGSALFASPSGLVAQVAFGFDSFYQCNWEFTGKTGKISVERAYTAPPTLAPAVRIERQNEREELTLPPDNHYRNKLADLCRVLRSEPDYASHWNDIVAQARQLQAIREIAISK